MLPTSQTLGYSPVRGLFLTNLTVILPVLHLSGPLFSPPNPHVIPYEQQETGRKGAEKGQKQEKCQHSGCPNFNAKKEKRQETRPFSAWERRNNKDQQ